MRFDRAIAGIVTGGCLAALLVAAAPGAELSARGSAGTPGFDVTGRWVMTLPAGWQRKVVIDRASDETYAFRGAGSLLHNGIYEFGADDGLFRLIEANHEGQTAYEWRVINANTLELVHQETNSGGNYVGATLSRHFDWDELVDNSPAPRVGTNSHGRRGASADLSPNR